MRTVRLAVLALAAAALFSTQDAITCGPFLPEYVFTPLHGPIDTGAYAHGNLGVLRPHFYREPLLIAYRYLSGLPLSAAEIGALYPQADAAAAPKGTPVERWLAERAKVPGAAKIEDIPQTRPIPGKDEFERFPNCLDDAFTSATATLADRAKRWGGGPRLAEWLRAQDQVFANCSAGEAIPAPLPPAADPLLAADRQYQIAAAEFYATKFAEAERDFAAIAGNADSPWRDSGAYLVARTLIREGTLLHRPEKLRDAQARLATLRANPRLRASAQGLEDFLSANLDAAGTLVKLGGEWMRSGLGGKARQVVTDYTHIWDREGFQPPVAQSELADWIATFQGASSDHAIERWRATKSVPWLVASVVAADPKNAAAPDLIEAARKLRPEAPAYPTATYYGIRLQLRRGERDAAREWADAALATTEPVSVVNLLRAERLSLARTWDEFLEYAVRAPVGSTTFEGGEEPDETAHPAFDLDFTLAMNRAVPLSSWALAAKAAAVPTALQADIAQAGWVRAVILGDAVAARNFALQLRDQRPPLAAAMRDYLAHPDSFTAALWMLRLPGFSTEVPNGAGRTTEIGKIDNYRNNWWSVDLKPVTREADANHEPLDDLYPPGRIGPSDFLPAAARAAGEAQFQKLAANGANGVDYLCATAIAYAKAHADDPRVPEALALAVRSTRYGMTDEASHAFSRQAFDLLHRRYPNSDWARKTKYYY